MKKIGFIGMGNKAKAMAIGFVRSGKVQAADMGAYAPNQEKLAKNAEEVGFQPYDNIESYISQGIWVPNYLLNAKTGEFTLNSTSSHKATINVGDTITIGGDNSEISVIDLGDFENEDGSRKKEGVLTLGGDGQQVISYEGTKYGYFGVGHGNAPDCFNANGSGFAVKIGRAHV